MRGRPISHEGHTKSPCFGCQERHAECHPTCEKYKEYEKAHSEEKDKMFQKRREYNLGFGAPYRSDKEWSNAIARESKREARVFKQSMK